MWFYNNHIYIYISLMEWITHYSLCYSQGEVWFYNNQIYIYTSYGVDNTLFSVLFTGRGVVL